VVVYQDALKGLLAQLARARALSLPKELPLDDCGCGVGPQTNQESGLGHRFDLRFVSPLLRPTSLSEEEV
jgi:hypothetical protein